MKILIALVLTLSLSGCSMFSFFNREKPIEVITTPNTRLPLLIQDLPPMAVRSPSWIIITPENVDEVWKRLEEEGADLVLFAVTDDGYEQLSLTFTDVRNRIHLQREIILQYKQYYEPTEQ